MKLYRVKYCANEYDDLGYDSPYPIFYSLDKDKARQYFEKLCNIAKQDINDLYIKHPEFMDNEDYGISEENENYLEYGMGKWFYQLTFDNIELEKDLRYER